MILNEFLAYLAIGLSYAFLVTYVVTIAAGKSHPEPSAVAVWLGVSVVALFQWSGRNLHGYEMVALVVNAVLLIFILILSVQNSTHRNTRLDLAVLALGAVLICLWVFSPEGSWLQVQGFTAAITLGFVVMFWSEMESPCNDVKFVWYIALLASLASYSPLSNGYLNVILVPSMSLEPLFMFLLSTLVMGVVQKFSASKDLKTNMESTGVLLSESGERAAELADKDNLLPEEYNSYPYVNDDDVPEITPGQLLRGNRVVEKPKVGRNHDFIPSIASALALSQSQDERSRAETSVESVTESHVSHTSHDSGHSSYDSGHSSYDGGSFDSGSY